MLDEIACCLGTQLLHRLTCLASSLHSLGTGLASMLAVAAAKAEDANSVTSSRMSYSRFLEYLDMGRVKKVGGALRVVCISLFNFMRALWSWSVG